LEYALEKQIPYGIWGGSTPADRDTVAIAKGKSYAFKGIALTITKLHKKGFLPTKLQPNLILRLVMSVVYCVSWLQLNKEQIHYTNR
jgi:hypothetical protein